MRLLANSKSILLLFITLTSCGNLLATPTIVTVNASEAPNSRYADNNRIIHITTNIQPIFLPDDTMPQTVTLWMSVQNDPVHFVWIGSMILKTYGQTIQIDRLVPGYTETWKVAVALGTLTGSASNLLLQNQLPSSAVVSSGFTVGGYGLPGSSGSPFLGHLVPIGPVTFSVPARSTTAPMQNILVQGDTASLTINTMSNAAWLSVNSANGRTPFSLGVIVNPRGLASGTYTGQLLITAGGFNNPISQLSVDVNLTVLPDDRPVITSVVNAASFKPIIGPGSWISVMGSNLAKSVMQQPTLPLPISLNGVSAELRGVGGVYNLLLQYLSPTQINAFVPQELPVTFFNTSCSVAVTVPTGSTSFTSNCQGLAPALFSYSTQQYASATHPDGAIVGVIAGTRPAQAGGLITLWGTGFGQTTPPVGNVNGVFAPQVLANPVAVYVGGQSVRVLWAGMVGTGLYQFNIQLPDNLTSGDVPISIRISGTETERVVLPVR